jgi:hypothetical protein
MHCVDPDPVTFGRALHCDGFGEQTHASFGGAIAAKPAEPRRPATEDVMMIEPPPARRMAGTAYFTDRNTPSRLIAVCRRQSANDISMALHRMPIPALAIITLSRPKRRSVASITRGHSSSILTSRCRQIASPPAAAISPTTACAPASSMSVMTTLAPSRARVAAHAAPIPDAPPVTIATLPSTWPIVSSLSVQFAVLRAHDF